MREALFIYTEIKDVLSNLFKIDKKKSNNWFEYLKSNTLHPNLCLFEFKEHDYYYYYYLEEKEHDY